MIFDSRRCRDFANEICEAKLPGGVIIPSRRESRSPFEINRYELIVARAERVGQSERRLNG